MAKRNKKGFMGNSHIPYAQRLKLQQQHEIITCRDHAARIAMYYTDESGEVVTPAAVRKMQKGGENHS
jgi:hypothetical protein